MGIGVLDVRTSEAVPGTIHLEHVEDGSVIDKTLGTLKHAQGKLNKIILAPQPSDDPNDPLNFSLIKKSAIVMIVYMGTVIHSATTALLLISGNVQIAEDLGISLPKMVQLSLGYYLLPAGVTCPFVMALARKYGKRLVYVFSSIVATVGCLVGATASGYTSLRTARILQGIGQTAFETLVFNTIADILFVHQRGPPVAIGVFSLNAVASIVGIVSGAITTRLGWRYCFWILLPFAAVQMILTVLFVPETAFRRTIIDEPDAVLEAEIAPSDVSARLHVPGISELKIAKDEVTTEEDLTVRSTEVPPRKSWLQELRLYDGTFVNDPLWRILLSFPVILLNFGLLFAAVCCGLSQTWFAATLTVASVVFPTPPYNYTTIQVGYASLAPAIGALVACLFMALTSDRVVRLLTHRNHGVYEPEFQLPLTFVGGACVIVGIVSFGYTLQQGQSAYVAYVCWAIASFGFACCNATYISYALSAFRDYSNAIIVMSVAFRNFLGYGMSIFLVPWLERQGPLPLLGALAGTIAGTLVLVLVFYVFGKRYRHFWNRYNVLKILHLETEKDG